MTGKDKKIRVCFIIPSLGVGGAQAMLVKLLSRIDYTRFEPEVISLLDEISIVDCLQGVPVHRLGMRNGVPDPLKLLSLIRKLRRIRPDLVHTWMYHADLIGGLAAWMAGVPVLWNIRHGGPQTHGKRMTLWTARLCARLSPILPRHIVCCAESALKTHAAFGYDSARMSVIPNGFEIERFRPDQKAREEVRRELKLSTDTPLVGLIARYHPVKDHAGFIAAAGQVMRQLDDPCFLLAGDGVTWENDELAAMIDAQGSRDRFRLLGRRSDIPRLTAALDIAVSASRGEAFSNTIGEAMACGVPCAVTDVGDSAYIVGDAGRVVPPANPEALARAVSELILLGIEGREELGRLSRKRVEEKFSLSTIINHYERLYSDVFEELRIRRGGVTTS